MNKKFKITWTEPTGSDVALDFMPNEGKIHGAIFFPKWVHERPESTVCYQNDYISKMEEAREKYDTYSKYVVPEFAAITYVGVAGKDNNVVISESQYLGMTYDIRTGKYFNEAYKKIKSVGM